MTPERWKQVKELFHSAIAREPGQRSVFLDLACAGDEELRKEVESLIRAHERTDSFMDSPALQVARAAAGHLRELAESQMLGHYKILSLIGAGGMGEVYLAQDTKLHRKIALKILPDDFAEDSLRIVRFEQEARAASALNHPNVCVIHEIGTTDDGRHFIAMEYIEGKTLRQQIAEKPLKLGEALDVAVQIADGLEAAHAEGVIHRDIKPENIMLRADGYVKVLDFGLAKFAENASNPPGISQASTIVEVKTEPGMRMGTVKYMSPEQLRDLPLDWRTDIWSLGVVLYEMVTGVTPFEAPGNNDVIALILEGKQPRLALSSAETPVLFQQVVQKALNKDREERYQTAGEFALELKKLRRQIETHETGTRGAGYTLNQIKAHRKAAIFAAVTTILAILLIIGRRPSSPTPGPSAPFQTIKMTPLTNSGTSVCASISPDGRYVAHAEDTNGRQELLLTNLVTGATSVLVPANDVKYLGITFSHDGNYLYFTRTEKGDVGILYQVALPFSAPKKIKEGIDSPITFSPNGERFSFVRVDKAAGEYSLMTARADGTGEQMMAKRRNGETFSLHGPAWSPDGKTIACAAGWWDNGYHMNVVEVGVEDGHVSPIGKHEWFSVLEVGWLKEESALIISARESPLSPFQLWRISYPQGESARLTSDIAQYRTVSLSSDKIVSVRSDQVWRIWVGGVQHPVPILSGVGDTYGLCWTGKGRIVFSSMAQDKLNITLIDPDGSNRIQLTTNAGDNYTPAASPDGRFIVFSSNRTGSFNIWRMNAEDGSDPRQLTFSDGNSYPFCSPDNEWVFYDNQTSATMTVWKVPIDGGEAVEVTDKYGRMPVVSPNNLSMAYRYPVRGDLIGIAILPLRGGSPTRITPIPVMDWQRVQWTADSRALTYINIANGISNIFSYDLSTGTSKQLTDFASDQIFAYSWSPDYRQLACLRGAMIRNVTIISSQR